MLSVASINQYYSGSHILRDVTLKLAQGEITALTGRNGVGKTTLLRCVMGYLPLASGTIAFDGAPIDTFTTEQRARSGMAIVPQGRMIFPRLTVEENLALALVSRRDGQRRIPDEVYEWFPVLADMRHRRGGDLSGGQQQQLAIGRALVQQPSLLLLDEPCEGIQPSIVQEIGVTLKRLNRELGLTILIVEQNLNFLRAV
ncbi:MAG: urea ABC transporter ATP-binding subunit UrtE, partial [Pseudomonadota bacterium]